MDLLVVVAEERDDASADDGLVLPQLPAQPFCSSPVLAAMALHLVHPELKGAPEQEGG